MPAGTEGENLYFVGCRTPPADLPPEVAGHKAANLIRMAGAGLPVPPGFVLPTALGREYHRSGRRLPEGFPDLLARAVGQAENATGLTFGGDRRPLLLSARSGAAVSMPGMMDTVLNLGLCDRTLAALVRMTGNPRHAWDSYRRLVQAYAEVVHGVAPGRFDRLLDEALRREGVPAPGELDVTALKTLTAEFLDLFRSLAGQPFPQDPWAQLAGAIEAVFGSWESPRAVAYRRLHRPEGPGGTAVTVQAMVFGNMGGTSGSGVAFTRDPATGENALYLDFAWNAQGEDVVSGRCPVQDGRHLQRALPGLYRDLREVGGRLERLFRDAQDFEFTVQEGRLYLLQSRDAKRTPWAALRIACELVAEGLIDEGTALRRLAPYDLDTIRNVRLAPAGGGGDLRPLCRGTPASPGVAVGEVALGVESAQALAAAGHTPILVRTDLSPGDVAGLAASAGVLTAHGGRTSHAAVVARQLNKVCIVGCPDLQIDPGLRSCRVGGRRFTEGEILSLDGHSGDVYGGQASVVVERPTRYLQEVKRWKSRRNHQERARP